MRNSTVSRWGWGLLASLLMMGEAGAFESWTLKERGDRGFKQSRVEWVDGKTRDEITNGTIQYALPKFNGDVMWDTLNAEPIVPDNLYGETVKYGYQLMVATWRYIGPDVEDPGMRYAGNRNACNNCHLGAGTFKYGAPWVGTYGHFPQYRNREDNIGTLTARINGCMERSMNGYRLPAQSKEMIAMKTYIHWLSEGIPVGAGNVPGRRITKVDRKMVKNQAADPVKGAAVYAMHCASCHGDNGQGVPRMDAENKLDGYIYPPLWGTDDTYNTGAGMYRTLKSADWIKTNMPKGTTANSPILTDEEAYNVAAFMNQDSHYHPIKLNRYKDFPDPKVRVPDHDVKGTYGENGEIIYPDAGVPRERYKVGPYKGIIKSKK